MRLRPWMPPLAAGLVGLGIGIAWPPPELPSLQSDAEAQWRLPAAEELVRFSDSDADNPLAGLRWNGELAAGGAQVIWRFAGVVSDPEPKALVLSASSNTPLRLGVGDALPDGSRITDIDRSTMTVEQHDGGQPPCTRTYQLFRQKPVASSPGCPALPEPGGAGQGTRS